jgi:ParB/RepB/Spo0J family partition protein
MTKGSARPPDAEVKAMEPRMIGIDRIRVLAGHNARDQVGDVSELAASIEELGVLQALLVAPLPDDEGGPLYGLIAGERRLTAARLAGRGEVPCTVLEGADARTKVAAMLAENMQREPLTPLQEASGMQRLVELGMSQREIAKQLGCGQSHVSKRLTLLTLPGEIQGAIDQPRDAGGITVAEALELAKLNDHPKPQKEAFVGGRRGHYGGVVGAVREALRQVQLELAKAQTREQLRTDGVRVLAERDYFSWSGQQDRPLSGQGREHDFMAIPLAVEAHRTEPCHAAIIDRDGHVVYVCEDPARHPEVDRKTAAHLVRVREDEQRQRVLNRLRRDAASGRRAAMERVLAAATTSQLTGVARQLVSSWRVEESKQACSLLGLQPIEVREAYGTHKNYQAALCEYAGTSLGAAAKALMALALACGEAHVGNNWMGPNGVGKRHMELLTAAGYQANDADRPHLTGERKHGRCRHCGATEADLLEDGREWAEDPARFGDLCSRCLAEMEDREEDDLDATPTSG